MKCKIADFNILFNNKEEFQELRCRKFASDFSVPDIIVCGNEEDIEKDFNEDPKHRIRGFHESTSLQASLAEQLPLHNAIWMHGAFFSIDGRGILLFAHSGIGKTTHMLLWKKAFGEKMTIVNGDKPIIRFSSNHQDYPCAYGAPWCGKENYGDNLSAKLTDICFIKRNEKNFVDRVKPEDAVNLIMQQVHIPKDPQAMLNTIGMVNLLLKKCSLWEINCNMELEAAKVAYKAIFDIL